LESSQGFFEKGKWICPGFILLPPGGVATASIQTDAAPASGVACLLSEISGFAWGLLAMQGVLLVLLAVLIGVLIRRRLSPLRARHAPPFEGEDLIRQIMDTSPVGIVLLDAQGRITFANAQAQQILGVEAEEIVGRRYDDSAWKITDMEGRPLDSEALPFRQVMTTGRVVFDYRHGIERGDGREMLLSVNAAPIFDARGRIENVVTIVNDITALAAMERELRRKEQFFGSVFDSIRDGISILDRDLNILRVNRWMEERYAAARGLVGRKCHEAYHRLSQPCRICPSVRTLATGQVHAEVMRLERDGGAEGWIELTSYPLRDSTGDVIGVIEYIEDITDRKEAQERLAESEERLRSILESAPVGLLTFVLEGDRLILTGYNKAAVRQSFVPLEEQVGRSLEEIFPLLTKTEVPERFAQICREGGIWREEQFEIAYSDQSRVYDFTAFQTAPRRMAVLLMDMTDRLRTRLALQESQRAMTTLISNLPGIVYRCGNHPDWPMQFISKGCEDVTGYTDMQFLSGEMHWNDLIFKEDQGRVWDQIQQAVAERKNYRIEYRIRTADGRVRWMWERGCAVWSDEGKAIFLEGFISDYTEFREAQERLAQRLRAEQFVSEISQTFANLPPDQIDQGIEQVLERIAGEFSYEFIQLAELMEDPSRIFLTMHPALPVEQNGLRSSGNIDLDFPYIAGLIRRHEIVRFDNLPEGLPDEAVRMREEVQARGLKSMAVIPMVVGPVHVGVMLLFSRQSIRLDENRESLLKLSADLMANAILRRRNARAIVESRQRFENMAQYSPMGILMYELESDGRLVLTNLNPAAERILGIRSEESIRRTLEEVFPPLAKTEIPERFRQLCREGGNWTVSQFDYPNETHPATYAFHAFQISPGRLAVMFEDIRERLLQHCQLQLNQFAMDHAGEAVYWIAEDARFLYVNEAACRMLEYSREELLAMTVVDIDPDLTAEAWRRAWEQLRRQRTIRLESQHQTREGRVFPIEITSSFFEYEGQELLFSFVRDISERQRQQQALQVTQFAVDHTGEAVYRISEDARFLYVNEAACRMLGYSREELLTMSVLDIDPDLTPERWKKIWEEAHRQKTNRMESRHRTRDGRIIPVEITGTRFEHAGEEINYTFVRDISERKAQEEAQQKLLRELEAKNEELESIVFIASHDLRSPLVNIEGFTGELQKACREIDELIRKGRDDPKVRQRIEFLLNQDIPESLGFITAGTSKMDNLLTGLLRLSRIGKATLHIRPIDMNALMKTILGSMRYQIRQENIEVELEELPPCMGDVIQINQVFTNLIDNAIKYRRPECPCRIRISGRREGERCLYRIEDNGIGIAPAYQERIFEIFHQLNPGSPKRGEGLGLTIVRRILERHNGSVSVESREGEGSTFIVSLLSVP
jgi:chemotaxis family two-component system sensor kinase Cph1